MPYMSIHDLQRQMLRKEVVQFYFRGSVRRENCGGLIEVMAPDIMELLTYKREQSNPFKFCSALVSLWLWIM